jgi:hypothetical protein
MSEVTTLEELDSLNDGELVRGYWDGYRNTAQFASRDKGYWHGYLNGQVDGGHIPRPSEAQMTLARLSVQRGDFAAIFATKQ